MRWMAAALLVFTVSAAELKPATSAAFDRYLRETEQRLDAHKGQLWADEAADRVRRVRGGEIVVQPFHAKALVDIGDALIHDWVGSIFLPGVTVEQTLRFVQDYDKSKQFFKPEVVDSKLLSHEGNHYRVFMRLVKKKVITVTLDTEHAVDYEQIDAQKWRSASRTTRISQVEHAGKRDENALPPGTGDGFLWRLNSYWRFQERDGGTWVECQAISLTRDIPTGLGWLIEPIIKSLPRDSLQNTLRGTRDALLSRAK